jgi:hypothetical protein
MKFHKELLHAIIDHLHLIISHHPDSQQFITPQLEKDYKFEIRKRIIPQKIKKKYRQLHQIHVSAFTWGRHCCHCSVFYLSLTWYCVVFV